MMKNNQEMTDLELNDVQVVMNKGQFELIGYDELKQKVVQIAHYLEGVEVTEDNIKENKKLVARVRKATDELNEGRIRFKKLYLEPYEAFAGLVKDITSIAKDAEETVRSQIRELEEIEREQKQREIEELFDKRVRPYEHKELLLFDDFFKSQYTNKTFPISKVEEEIVKFLEKRESDYELLCTLAGQLNIPTEDLIAEYIDSPTHEVSAVVNKVNDESLRKQEIKKKLKAAKPDVKSVTDYCIRFSDAENYYKALHLLDKENISYQEIK